MDRRKFLKTTAGSALIIPGAFTGFGDTSSPAPAAVAREKFPPSAFTTYTAEDHRRRLQNIALCERSIGSCMRKQLVSDYLPGQCTYNLGEYPCRTPWEIGDYDVEELDRLKAHGIGLIQLHEEWNDSQRLFVASVLPIAQFMWSSRTTVR
jgi:hypothetical protein